MDENEMLEQTSPAEQESLEELFTDPSQPEDAQEEPQEQEQDQQEADGQEEAVYTVKYNGQQIEMPLSQLLINAQKGMNYDHVYSQLQQLRGAREFAVIDRFAKKSGLTREEYLNQLERQEYEDQIAQQTAKGVPEDVARRLLALERQNQLRAQQEQAKRIQQARRQQFVELAREYPDIKEFPQEVVDAVAHGDSPLSAYRAYENKMLRDKLQIYEKNQKNREKAAGSATGELADDGQDGFMNAFAAALSQ